MSRDAIDPAAVTRALLPPIAGPVEWHRVVGSTNDLLAERARAGAGEGLVIGADHQTAGRGRMGRSWRDVAGSTIAMSVLLRPPGWIGGRAGALSLAVAVAVASGLAPDARVAWPNDVLRHGRKVAGILLEAAWERGSLSWVVVGIGVNVRGVPDVPAGSWPVGALDQEGPVPPRGEVVAAVLVELARGYTRFCEAGTSEMITAFRARDALAGRSVRVRRGGVVRVGTADGVEPDGSLRLRTEAGIETFAGAERLELVGG